MFVAVLIDVHQSADLELTPRVGTRASEDQDYTFQDHFYKFKTIV